MLVELMGGEITVNSVYLQGTTFTVSLYQKISDPTEIGEISIISDGTNAKRNKYESSFVAPEGRILIVDDNEMNLQVEKKLLHDTALMIDTVMSGQEANLDWQISPDSCIIELTTALSRYFKKSFVRIITL